MADICNPTPDPRKLQKDVPPGAAVNRLLYFAGLEVDIEADADADCGTYSLVALGLTEEEIVLLQFLLTMPFQILYWPFLGILDRQHCANLYNKILGG
jgi:hypothetical protein